MNARLRRRLGSTHPSLLIESEPNGQASLSAATVLRYAMSAAPKYSRHPSVRRSDTFSSARRLCGSSMLHQLVASSSTGWREVALQLWSHNPSSLTQELTDTHYIRGRNSSS